MFRLHCKRVPLKPHRVPGKWWFSVSEGGNLPLLWREGEKGERPWLQGVSKRAYQTYVREIRERIAAAEHTDLAEDKRREYVHLGSKPCSTCRSRRTPSHANRDADD